MTARLRVVGAGDGRAVLSGTTTIDVVSRIQIAGKRDDHTIHIFGWSHEG